LGINARIAIGTGWVVAVRLADRLVGLISITILARLLVPQDFGLVAYAMALMAILELFLEFNFDAVIIRDQSVDRSSYDTAWTLNVVRGAVLCLLLVAGAGVTADFFNEPRVELIVYALALVPLLRGIENIGVVDFQKYLQFDREFYFNCSVRLIATIVTIGLALTLRSYWALVFGTLGRSLIRVILSFAMSRYRPRPRLSEFSRMFGFSKWLLVQSMLYGITSRISTIVLGRYHSAQVLAFFNMALELINLASLELAAPMRRALFPGIASIAHDREQLLDTFKGALAAMAFVGLPVTIGIAAVAPLAVPILLGDGWSDVVPIVQVLALTGVTVVLYPHSHVVYLVLNKPILTAAVEVIRVVLVTPLMFLAVPEYGALGAAAAFTTANVVVFVIDYILVLTLLNIRFVTVIGVLWRSIVAVSLMLFAVIWTMRALPPPDTPAQSMINLLACMVIGVASYFGIAMGAWLLVGRPRGAEASGIVILRKLTRLIPLPAKT
jgi:lipopolysaccharide exporter